MGFSKAFEQIAADIQKNLAEKKYQEKSLFITGHSLGGALATVAIKRFTHEARISACYTFSSPRIANKNWIEASKLLFIDWLMQRPCPYYLLSSS